jgi:carboxymethylenebutenolidase
VLDAANPQLVEFAGHGGQTIRGLFTAPATRARAPGVVLVHEVFGLDAHMREVARRLAAEGFAVLAPDLWSREAERAPASGSTVEQMRAAVQALPDRRVLGDLEGALAWLEKRAGVDGSKLAAVGFCMGGNHAYQLGCASRRVKAVVDFYGRLVYRELDTAKPMQPLEFAFNLSVPILCFFGESDASIPREHVERLRELLTQGAKHFEIVTYPGAGHGFFNDTRPSFVESAARDAWTRTLAFLRETLEPEVGE